MKKLKYILLVAILPFIYACSTTDGDVDNAVKDDKLTVAKAQSQIRVGMSSTEVVEVLGSPNMVTTDDQHRETWIYDKVSTSVQSSSSMKGVWFLIVGGQSNTGSRTSSQKTLTIIVKFDNNNKVRDFSYRT